MNGCTVLLVWTVRSSSSLCWAWLLAAGGGEWGFILPDYDVAAAAAWLLCHGPDLRPTAPATATANTLRFTTRYNRQQRATTTHHITAQHNISFFFRTPGSHVALSLPPADLRSNAQLSGRRPAQHILQVSAGRIFYKYFTQQNIYTFR